MASSSTDISTERSRWHDVVVVVVVVVASAVDAVVASIMPQLIVVDNVGGEQSGILSMMLVERHSSRRRMSDDQASSMGVDRVGAWNIAPGLVVCSIPPPLLSYLNFVLSSVCECSNNDDDDDDDDGGEDRRPMTIFVRDIMFCGSGINK